MKSLLVGLLLGLAIGLSIGLLMAPSPGSETRQKLRERAEPTLERIRVRVRRNSEKEAQAA